MVSHFYHVEVVFNNYHGVAAVDKSAQDIKEYAYILKMKTCCWLVKNKQGLSGVAFRQFGGKLHSLALATR